MSQLNIHLTAGFEKDLRRFMKLRHIDTKSEAIRVAIREGVERAIPQVHPADLSDWLGMGLQVPVNKKKRFSSDNDLWE